MDTSGKKPVWIEDFKQYLQRCRLEKPIPSREDLSAQQEQMCRINGGTILSWFQKHSNKILDNRAKEWVFKKVLNEGKELNKTPYIIFLTDITGLVASTECFEKIPPKTFFLLPEEFGRWPKVRDFDPQFLEHIEVSSYFSDEADDDLIAKMRDKHPIPNTSTYWFHHEGTMYGHLAGLGGTHVWEYRADGTPILLEEAVEKWVS